MTRKFAFLLALVMAMVFPAISYGADSLTLSVTGTTAISRDIEIVSDDSGDITAINVTYHEPYTFASIQDAVSFASDPTSYLKNITNTIKAQYSSFSGTPSDNSGEVQASGGVEVELTLATNEAANIDTSSVSDLTIKGNNKTITAPAGSRHFTVSSRFKMEDLTLEGGNSSGGITITGSTSTFSRVKFQNNSSTFNGGVLNVSGGTVEIADCTFTGNSSSGSNGGGAIYAGGGTVNIAGSNTFRGNTADAGGAIYVYGGTVSIADNPTFSGNGSTSNSTTNNGGAIYISSGNMTFRGRPTFTANKVASNGGAVYVQGGEANFGGSSVSFTSNDAGVNGGGVYISGGTVSITSATFENNKASSQGGGLYASGGTINLPTPKFTNNEAGRGGGIYTATGITISGQATFTGNTASADNGGGMFISSSVGSSNAVNFEEAATFENNTAATNGGGIYSEGHLTFASTSAFRGNNAENGGGAYLAGTATFTGVATFSNNNVVSGGGGLYASGNVTLAGLPTFSGNYSTNGGGGALYISDTGDVNFTGAGSVRFTGNNWAVNGGAVYSAGKLTFAGSPVFSENHTVNNGNGGAVYLANASTASINVNGSSELTFSNNYSARHGGAMYISQNARAAFAPVVTFSENRANNGNGGAVWIHTLSRIAHSSDVNFNDNRASRDLSAYSSTDDPLGVTSGNGGAIFIGATTRSPRAVVNNSFKFGGEAGNWAYHSGGAICSASADITISAMTITDTNTAENGGGGFVNAGLGSSDITVSNSTIRNQTAKSGGALRGSNMTITSSDFYTNHSNGDGSAYDDGGGAIFANGRLNMNNVRFYSNDVTGSRGNGGGAVVCKTGRMADVYFTRNSSNGNGGALSILGSGTTYTEIARATFSGNTAGSSSSTLGSGGAIMAYGNVSMDKCYLVSNAAYVSGGAISYAQFGGNAGSGIFRLSKSMLEENNTGLTAGSGGAMYIHANQAIIDSCTFSHNQGRNSAGSIGGGAINLETAGSLESEITNSTFVRNAFTSSNGGALAFSGNLRVRSCTFSLSNSAGTGNGGGIYIARNSTLYIDSSIVVGNEAGRGADIWSEGGTINNERGYNRIGTYGTGNSDTSWRMSVGGTTDRESGSDSGVAAWETATFFGRNAALADNPVPGDNSKPPVTGYEVTKALQTLMLSEDKNLRASYRATNIIPYDSSAFYLQYDERGRDRRALGTNIDIGACFNDNAVRTNPDDDNTNLYAISRIQLSGIPNSFRQIGQTAHITARVYFVNETYSDDARVVWGVEPAGSTVLSYDQNGNYTVMNPGTAYITVRTQATKNDGTYATARYAVIVTDFYAGILNTSTEYYRALLRNYNQTFDEYQITFDYPTSGTSSVNTSAFQSNFSSIWGTAANLLTAPAESTSSYAEFTPATSGYSSSGYSLAKNAGVSVRYPNRSKGDILPVSYNWEFSSSDVRNLLGSSLSGNINSDSSYESIFQILRLDFTGNGTTRPVIGSGGISASEARENQVLTMTSDSTGKLTVSLIAYLANVSATGSGDKSQLLASSVNTSGAQFVRSAGGKLLVVPDGSDSDGTISGTMWAAKKTGNDSSSGNSNSESSGSGGGGGGCESAGFILPLVAAFFVIKRRK